MLVFLPIQMCHWVRGLFTFPKKYYMLNKNIIFYIFTFMVKFYQKKFPVLQNLRKNYRHRRAHTCMIFHAVYVNGIFVNSLILLIFWIDFKTLSQKSTNRLNGSERKVKEKKNRTRFRWKKTSGNLWAINTVEKIKNDASSVYTFVEIDTYEFIRCTMVKPGSPT